VSVVSGTDRISMVSLFADLEAAQACLRRVERAARELTGVNSRLVRVVTRLRKLGWKDKTISELIGADHPDVPRLLRRCEERSANASLASELVGSPAGLIAVAKVEWSGRAIHCIANYLSENRRIGPPYFTTKDEYDWFSRSHPVTTDQFAEWPLMTLGDLTSFRPIDLLRKKNIGPVTVAEIRNTLEMFGLHLKGEST
jgi:hypothetical protein